MTLLNTPASDQLATFSRDAESALVRLQRALAACLESMDPQPVKAPEIGRALGLDKSLAWKIHRLVFEAVPQQIAQFVPGEAGLNIVVRAMEVNGVAPALLAAVRAAMGEYLKLVKVHGGDRASVELMLMGDEPPDRAQLTLRRTAFRASSFVVGLQARTHIQAFFVGHGSESGKLDIGLMRSYVDLRRLRPRAPFVLNRPTLARDDGQLVASVVHESLEFGAELQPGEAADEATRIGREIGLVTEFSSHPTPRFVRSRMVPGRAEYELADGPVGKTGDVTFVIAEVLRNAVEAVAGPGNERAEHSMQLRVPCQAALLDVFVQRGVFPEHTPEPAVYSEYNGEEFHNTADRERYRLPGQARPAYLGRGAGAANTSDMPRYATLVQRMFERQGWDGAEFDLYRARIEYPFVPCAMVMSHPMRRD